MTSLIIVKRTQNYARTARIHGPMLRSSSTEPKNGQVVPGPVYIRTQGAEIEFMIYRCSIRARRRGGLGWGTLARSHEATRRTQHRDDGLPPPRPSYRGHLCTLSVYFLTFYFLLASTPPLSLL